MRSKEMNKVYCRNYRARKKQKLESLTKKKEVKDFDIVSPPCSELLSINSNVDPTAVLFVYLSFLNFLSF